MATVTKRQFAAAMWENRPTFPELLFFTIAVLAAHLLIDVPVTWLGSAVLLIVVGGTVQQALVDLRKAAAATDAPATGEGDDAED
jgi:hypothetical protein